MITYFENTIATSFGEEREEENNYTSRLMEMPPICPTFRGSVQHIRAKNTTKLNSLVICWICK